MSNANRTTQDQERAWNLLATVEQHPQVREWLEEAGALAAQRTRRFARAAGFVLALGLSMAAYLHWTPPRYETRIGEQRDVLLPDGSRVTLNTNTALAVRYANQRRYIELERGEALFAVKHDATRPFEVSAGGTLTRALGTEFNIDLRSTKVTVSVLEGLVRVSAADAVSAGAAGNNRGSGGNAVAIPPAALAEGQALEFRPQERRTLAERADLRRIDAWRTRRLEFSDTPLLQALEEFNRYSTTKVVLGARELGTVRLSGVFRIGDTEGFLFSLREVLGMETHALEDEVVLMRRPREAEPLSVRAGSS